MRDRKRNGPPALKDRINAELQDSFDEELEMELDDDRLDHLLAEGAARSDQDTLDRRIYF